MASKGNINPRNLGCVQGIGVVQPHDDWVGMWYATIPAQTTGPRTFHGRKPSSLVKSPEIPATSVSFELSVYQKSKS
jgi:hypothetical protein